MKPQVILGFDMETDIGSWTPFYEGLVHGTPRILEVLARHDVEATFFFVGDAARTHPEIVRMVDNAGHEVGCHTLYHETIGDEMFSIPGVKPVLPEECYHRIEVATDVIEQVLGSKVRSFRAPRLWGSTAMVNALEDLGYAADASYPMFFFKDRLAPYHPSRKDWTQEGDMRILEIPNFANMVMDSICPTGADRNQWPILRVEGADVLMTHVDSMLELYRRNGLPAVLCFYLHPWEFYEMAQGLIHYGEGAVLPDSVLTKNCGDIAIRELDRMLVMLRDREVEFRTACQLAACY